MRRWAVILNCVTPGFVNCLSVLNPGTTVEGYTIWQFQTEFARLSTELKNFDCIFLYDDILALNLIDFSQFDNVVQVPLITFSGYHPDHCFVSSEAALLNSPIGVGNSMIAFAAFKKSLSVADTLALYNRRTFEAGAFFDLWQQDKLRLFQRFVKDGYDLAGKFRRWSMRDSFMYTIHHPKIDCIYDIAVIASERAGARPVTTSLRPHDNLSSGPIFAIYDEIAEALGIERSSFFSPGQYKMIGLEQFILASFEIYRAQKPESLVIHPIYERRYSAIYDFI